MTELEKLKRPRFMRVLCSECGDKSRIQKTNRIAVVVIQNEAIHL